MVICWERADPLAFRWCCFILCRLHCLYFPFWCLGQDVQFDCIGSWSLPLIYFLVVVPNMGLINQGKWWMDELGFYVPDSISVISRRWKVEHERLCAMKRRLGRISPPARFEPATPWSEVGSANRSATRTLPKASECALLQLLGFNMGQV